MVTAGLTGGIASGKSIAAVRLRELGARVIDSDRIARQLVEPGSEGLRRIVDVFGSCMLSDAGDLDRERLGRVVFTDAGKRKMLDGLLHPLIFEEIDVQRARLRADGFNGVVVVDVPLLIECGRQHTFDRVIVVYCDPAIQRRRLMLRSGLSAGDADARLAAQMPIADKLAYADYVIDNRGTPEDLHDALTAVYESLLRQA